MRPDGRRLKTIDPLFGIIPHIMPHRYDAQVYSEIEIDYSLIKDYISSRKKEGNSIRFMTVLIAAYMRTCAKVPELNRFIMNKKVYYRTEFCVSFVTLKVGETRDDKIEAIVKIPFNFTDTIDEISKKIDAEIDMNRKPEQENFTDKLINFFMGIPLIPGGIISFVKFLDKIGLMPKMIIDGSPFHTTLFVTNMSSINMPAVYHHLYEFGTTSVFIAIGKMLLSPTKANPKRKIMNIKGVIDERICAGATISKANMVFQQCLKNPKILETALKQDEVVQDIK
jgi:hypothetical protein